MSNNLIKELKESLHSDIKNIEEIIEKYKYDIKVLEAKNEYLLREKERLLTNNYTLTKKLLNQHKMATKKPKPENNSENNNISERFKSLQNPNFSWKMIEAIYGKKALINYLTINALKHRLEAGYKNEVVDNINIALQCERYITELDFDFIEENLNGLDNTSNNIKSENNLLKEIQNLNEEPC